MRQQLGRAVPKPEPQSGPLQLSGRVVDDSGRPLAGAHVLIAEYDADKPGSVSTVSAADGSFEARGEWTTSELVMRATHEDCWNSGYRRVLRGTEGVDLQLERYSTLSGVLEMRNGRALPDLLLELTSRDTNKSSSANLDFASSHGSIVRIASDPFTCTKDGAFTIHGLRPGLYDLTVRGDRLREIMVHVPEVRVGAGEPPSPASCNPLRL